MSSESLNAAAQDVGSSETSETESKGRKPYEPPRIEKRRSVARVTLLSGMGNSGVGLINMMP
jgi:hypothetical protein